VTDIVALNIFKKVINAMSGTAACDDGTPAAI
jgi:hypothetical protein